MVSCLIINADDFGLSRSVNRGILAAFRNETVTSATLMVNMPGFHDAVKIAQAESRLGVGLHFNLSYGKPISSADEVPSLVNSDGEFALDVSNDIQHAIRSLRPEEVLVELRAQWKRFRRAGLRPTHIDSHHLIHSHDPIYTIVANFANAHNVPIRRVSPPPSLVVPQPQSTERLIVDAYFKGDGRDRILNHISKLSPGVTELICHPGYVDEDVIRISSWTYVREVELRVFTDPLVRSGIEKSGVKRIHFGHLQHLPLQ